MFLALSCAALTPACGGGHATASKGPQAAAALPPANPQAVTKMVQGVVASRDPNGRDRAIALLREAISIDDNLWEARYDLGVVLASAGDLAGAEKELRAAAKLAPDAADVVVALAEVQRRRGEPRDAADTLGDFIESHPNATEAKALYVSALRGSGQVDKAMTQAHELLVKKPGDASALAELALCHLAKGEKDTAQLLAKQALESNPKSAVAERATGLIQLANGDDALAFQSFLKATQEDPTDTTARLNMGAVLLRAGAYPRAEEQFRAIIQLDPENADANVGLAAALRGESTMTNANGQPPPDGAAKQAQAEKILEAVLNRDAHNTSALFNLGVLYADFLKKPDDAKKLFKRYLSDAPKDDPARADAEKYLSTLDTSAPDTKPAPAPPPANPPKGAPPPKGGKK
ncbi:MAG: tetratricopeptide repeat protein [Polyangiaceae bacterium]